MEKDDKLHTMQRGRLLTIKLTEMYKASKAKKISKFLVLSCINQ